MSNFLHRLAHRLDPSKTPCICRVTAFHDAIAMRRDAALRELTLPSSPAALDAELRRKIAESEA